GFDQSRIVTLAIPDELVVWADEGRVRQILVNLLSNALKYSTPGTPLLISASAYEDRRSDGLFGQSGNAMTPESSRMVRVSMQDQGLGVPPHDVAKLVNRFVRLGSDIAGNRRCTGVCRCLSRQQVEAL